LIEASNVMARKHRLGGRTNVRCVRKFGRTR